jgi:thiamine transport system substrate-binding protein
MRAVAAIALTTALLVGSTPADAAPAQKRDVTITLVTHDSFAVSKKVLRAFMRDTGITVKILRAGDAGAALNQAILTKDAPLGDVFFGVDNTLLSRALTAGIFEKYRSPELAHVRAEYQIDATHQVTPVDHGDVCINTDKAWFAHHHLAVPKTLDDLADPKYRGLLVAENPATSSPGLAFVLATIAHYGERRWRAYWKRLRANDVQIVSGWEEAYNGAFSAGEGTGDRPLVVSYASSPPAAVYFSDPQPATSPVGTVLKTCFRQVETVGVLRGTEHEAAARRFVDFMLSERVQADVPLQMFVFPVRDGVPLPPVFTKFADVPPHPLALAPARIGRDRDRWVDEWTETVLR